MPVSKHFLLNNIYLLKCFRFTLILSKVSTEKTSYSDVEIKESSRSSVSSHQSPFLSPVKSPLRQVLLAFLLCVVTRNLFPNTNFICSKYRIQRYDKEHKNIVILPEKVVTIEADVNINAASAKNMRDFLNKNKDLDVIAKQLQSHDKCCKLFTCGLLSEKDNSLSLMNRQLKWNLKGKEIMNP